MSDLCVDILICTAPLVAFAIAIDALSIRPRRRDDMEVYRAMALVLLRGMVIVLEKDETEKEEKEEPEKERPIEL